MVSGSLLIRRCACRCFEKNSCDFSRMTERFMHSSRGERYPAGEVCLGSEALELFPVAGLTHRLTISVASATNLRFMEQCGL